MRLIYKDASKGKALSESSTPCLTVRIHSPLIPSRCAHRLPRRNRSVEQLHVLSDFLIQQPLTCTPDLQTQKKLTSLSWEESSSGPENAPIHMVICKSTRTAELSQFALVDANAAPVDGKPYGVGTGSQKHAAKDIAAKEALKALTGEPE
jgi:hypothetical protein